MSWHVCFHNKNSDCPLQEIQIKTIKKTHAFGFFLCFCLFWLSYCLKTVIGSRDLREMILICVCVWLSGCSYQQWRGCVCWRALSFLLLLVSWIFKIKTYIIDLLTIPSHSSHKAHNTIQVKLIPFAFKYIVVVWFSICYACIYHEKWCKTCARANSSLH